MTQREDLQRLISQLSEDEIEDTLAYVQWLIAEDEELTGDELAAVEAAKEEVARGEYVSLEELRQSLASHGV